MVGDERPPLPRVPDTPAGGWSPAMRNLMTAVLNRDEAWMRFALSGLDRGEMSQTLVDCASLLALAIAAHWGTSTKEVAAEWPRLSARIVAESEGAP